MMYLQHENNIDLIIHVHQSSWATRCIVSEESYVEKNLFLSNRSQQCAENTY